MIADFLLLILIKSIDSIELSYFLGNDYLLISIIQLTMLTAITKVDNKPYK